MLSGADVRDLIAERDSASPEHKPGGVTDTRVGAALAHPAVARLVRAARGAGAFVTWARFVDTPFAFVIHADTGDGSSPDDAVVIVPLDSAPQPAAATVFFRQHWLGPSANFVRGTPEFPGKANITVSDYNDVQGRSEVPFPEGLRASHLSHLRPEWLVGLSFDTLSPWSVGSAIVFPCSQLHCGASMQPGARKRSLVLHVRAP